MAFDPTLAEIRFGCGRAPGIPAPGSAAEMIDALGAPDAIAARFPIETFETFLGRMTARTELVKQRRKSRGTPEFEQLGKTLRVQNREARQDHWRWMAAHFLRRAHSTAPFKERLEGFWADHFTATGKRGLIRRATSPYTESAIRPHLASPFETLLFEAVTHPVMVHYLDQERSVGPNSARAKASDGKFGLNENLAREILELHTLGVDGPYTQTDVTELAELLTGLTLHTRAGRHFQKALAEPGAETVLGKTYGGDDPHLRDIKAVLRDLARHPATARHVATKLAVHFVSDQPDPALVAAMEGAYLDSRGDLSRVYAAMLGHPSAWEVVAPNVKRPFEFMSSACRALAVDADVLLGLNERQFMGQIFEPLRLMGHIWQRPSGPDGLEEADSAWITPQGLAARLQWAVAMPRHLQPDLPDPRDFVETALGPMAPEAVRFAAAAAETRAEGVGLILASPAFQRM